MCFTLFNLIVVATPQESTSCSFIGQGKSGEVSDKAAQFIKDQILVCLNIFLELFFLRLNDSFEILESPLENILIAFRVEATFEEIGMACLLSVNLTFPFLASEGIFDFQSQHVINAFFPVVHI